MAGPAPTAPPPPAGAPRSTEPPPDWFGTTAQPAPRVPRWYALPTQHWDIPSALVPWYVLAGAVLLTLGAGLALRAAHVPVAEPVAFAASLLAYGLVAVAAVIVLRRHGVHDVLREIGLRFRPIDLALGLGAFVAAMIVRLALAAVVVGITGPPSHGNIPPISSPVWFVLEGLLLACIVAPVVEESIARGLLLRAVRARALRTAVRRGTPVDDRGLQVRAAWIAVLVSSGVFTLAHLYEGVDDWRVVVTLIVSILPLALAAGWLAILTGRLGAGIVMHALTNLTATAIAFATIHR